MNASEPDFDADKFVASLLLYYEQDPENFKLTPEALILCLGEEGEVLPDRFNAIGERLAYGYYERHFSFEFCDLIVNALTGPVFSDAVAHRDTWPDLFWEVFLAFDAGEFYREGEPDIDPSEKYTRPLIANIIKAQENH